MRHRALRVLATVCLLALVQAIGHVQTPGGLDQQIDPAAMAHLLAFLRQR